MLERHDAAQAGGGRRLGRIFPHDAYAGTSAERHADQLADLQDFSYKEIAEVMDCPVGTVMSRLHRARKALQKKLAGYAREQGYLRPPAPEATANDDDTQPTSLDAWREQRKENGSR